MASASVRPMVIAHRGASGYRPEHGLAAFELAIAQGADAVEPDLVPSRDGVLVVRHENELSGTTDVAAHPEFADRRTTKLVDDVASTGWFTEDFTWAELSILRVRERLPKVRPANTAFDGRGGMLRLVDLLALLDRHPPVHLVAELKHAAYFAALGFDLDGMLLAELAAAGWSDPGRVTVESFELTVLGRLRGRGWRGSSVYLVERRGAPADRPGVPFSADLTAHGLRSLADVVDGVSFEKSMLMRTDAGGSPVAGDLTDRVHEAGLLAYCWTLRAENRFLLPAHRSRGSMRDLGDWRAEFGLLMRTGLDGVFADQPDLAIRARAVIGESTPA